MSCSTFSNPENIPERRKLRLRNATHLHESNFSKLQRVIPGIQDISSPLHLQGYDETRLVVEILEKSKFTTTFSLRLQQYENKHWLPALHMKVRSYHDAHVTEVLAFQGHHRLDARYEYPNPKMYQRDEKWQLNIFLGDWLDHCLHRRCIFEDEIQPRA